MTAHRDAELMQQDAEPVAANRKWLKKAAVCENP